MRDLDEAMQPSATMQESVRLLESASLGICDMADRIEEYLPEAKATLTGTSEQAETSTARTPPTSE